jgi:predicted acylesterase/phospholipase RssA
MTVSLARRRLSRLRVNRIARKSTRAARRWVIGLGVTVLAASMITSLVSSYFERTPAPADMLTTVASMPDAAGVRFWGDEVPGDLATAVARWIPHLPRLATTAPRVGDRPLVTYLALSGGGSDGAFGAGLLAGWTQSGQRPQFEVVTGVSAGALIAPFAFLGSDYDAALRDVWTSYGTKDIAPRRLVGFLGGPSVADTAPLKRIIARYVDATMLARIAAEYKKGRLLLVVSTQLDAQRPMVWNLGEIANRGGPEALELVHQVLMASSAIPGFFPPVNIRVRGTDGKIYDEMHVDGGVTREVFVAPAQLSFSSFDPFYPVRPNRRIFIIKNGKTEPEYQSVKASTLSVIERSLWTMIKSHQLSDIYRIYRLAKDDGVEFNVAAVPPTFNTVAKETFDKAYLADLYQIGVEHGRDTTRWLVAPPEYRPLAVTR